MTKKVKTLQVPNKHCAGPEMYRKARLLLATHPILLLLRDPRSSPQVPPHP
jgi:hypothetical protein